MARFKISLADELNKIENDSLSNDNVSQSADDLECFRCHRTPLVGEVVYQLTSNKLCCSLCRKPLNDEVVASHPVRHGQLIRAERIQRVSEGDLAVALKDALI